MHHYHFFYKTDVRKSTILSQSTFQTLLLSYNGDQVIFEKELLSRMFYPNHRNNVLVHSFRLRGYAPLLKLLLGFQLKILTSQHLLLFLSICQHTQLYTFFHRKNGLRGYFIYIASLFLYFYRNLFSQNPYQKPNFLQQQCRVCNHRP